MNPATGAVTGTIGAIGFSVTGLAVQPGTGVLYGVTATGGPNPRSLITINKTTGVGTLVGALVVASPVADITFSGGGTLYGWSEDTDDLVTINLTTGAATVVADSTVSTRGSGLAAGAGNVLYFAGEDANGALRTVTRSTGLTAVVATMSGAANERINAMAFNGATLYGSRTNTVYPFTATTLVTINTTTGAITSLGASLATMDALVFNIF